MTTPNPSVGEVLDREFLMLRAALIDVAATLDRIDRAEGRVDDDPRVDQIRRGLEVIRSTDVNRAEQLQRIFSLPYDAQWREK